MTVLMILGGLVFEFIVLFVVFSNVYLELASRRAREGRQRARLKRAEVDRSNSKASNFDARKDEALTHWEGFAV